MQPKPNIHTWCTNLTVPPPTQGTNSIMASPMQTIPGVSPIREFKSISQGECTSAVATYELRNHSECLSDCPPKVAHRKRTASRNSPHSTPSKMYRSPAPKVRRRKRTGLEGNTHSTYQTELTEQNHRPTRYTQRNALELASFQQSASEEAVLQTLREQMDLYVLLQYHVHNQLSYRFELDSPVVLNMQDYMKLVRPVIPDKSMLCTYKF